MNSYQLLLGRMIVQRHFSSICPILFSINTKYFWGNDDGAKAHGANALGSIDNGANGVINKLILNT